MTDEELEGLKHYARKVFYSNRWNFSDMTFEDVYAEFVLAALEKGRTAGIATIVKCRHTCAPEAVGIRKAIPFGSISLHNHRTGEEFDALDNILALSSCDTYFKDDDACLKAIAEHLYGDVPERAGRFLDYVYGMPVRGDYARTIREKLYRRGAEVLGLLFDYGKISEREYQKYLSLLAVMDNYAPQKRRLINTSNHADCRAYYQRHGERILANARERNARKRLKTQAE
mgnify:FL=1